MLCAADKAPEESLKKTIEVDRLIDMLRDANPRELDQIVVENVLAFDAGFWVRLAARIDICKSDDDKAWFHIRIQFAFLWMLLSSIYIDLTL